MAKLDEIPLTKAQRAEIHADLANGVGNTHIARKVEAFGHSISEKSIRRYRKKHGYPGCSAPRSAVVRQPRILMIDIETTPHLVYAWGLWRTTIGIHQIVEHSRVLCFSAKWFGEKKTMFFKGDGMVEAAWRLLDEADWVIHYNGTSFDLPHLNREFIEANLTPPSPYKQIDLLTTVRKQFNFASTKLAYVSKELELEGKIQHEGFDLWTRCMANDPVAWAKMERYNRRDVDLLEDVYTFLRPWIISHPSYAAMAGATVCPSCGSTDLVRQGYAYTAVSKFPRYSCTSCGRWSRSTHRVSGSALTNVA